MHKNKMFFLLTSKDEYTFARRWFSNECADPPLGKSKGKGEWKRQESLPKKVNKMKKTTTQGMFHLGMSNQLKELA